MSTIDFGGQVVLVTGAGRGLGAAYALLLGSHDAVVAVHDAGVGRDGTGADPGLARGVRDAVVSGGGMASAHVQDLATRSGCEDLVAEVLDTHGRIDALVHNAGIVRYLRIAETQRGGLAADDDLTSTEPAAAQRRSGRRGRAGHGRVVLSTDSA